MAIRIQSISVLNNANYDQIDEKNYRWYELGKCRMDDNPSRIVPFSTFPAIFKILPFRFLFPFSRYSSPYDIHMLTLYYALSFRFRQLIDFRDWA